MSSEVIHAWHVNGLAELIAALDKVKEAASSEGCAAEQVNSDIHLVSLVRTIRDDGSSVLDVHFRA